MQTTRQAAQPNRTLNALRTHALMLLDALRHRAQPTADDGGAADDDDIADAEDALRDADAANHDADAAEPGNRRDVPTAERAWFDLLASLEIAAAEFGEPAADRWRGLQHRLGVGRHDGQLLALLVVLAIDEGIARLYRSAWGDAYQHRLSWGFAVQLLCSERAHEPGLEDVAAALSPTVAPALRLGLVGCQPDPQGLGLSDMLFDVPDDVAAALAGLPAEMPALLEDVGTPHPRVQRRLSARIASLAERGRALRVAIQGPEGAGRRRVAAAFGRRMDLEPGLWVLDLGAAVDAGEGHAEVARAIRMAALTDTVLVIAGSERLGDAPQRVWHERIGKLTDGVPVPIVWLFEAEVPEWTPVPDDARLGLGYPTRPQRFAEWKRHLGDRLDDGALDQLAGQFLLSEGQIERSVTRALAECDDDAPEVLFDTCCSRARGVTRLGLGKLATPEPGRVEMRQLILDEEASTALDELVSYAGHRHLLAEDWGFAQSMPYGLGVTALFTGPPGTGKTFAAQAVATELGLELYRIDLSQLVSKYIGETEKHLSEVFAAAEQGEVMLLFDEADSLFGKRTEVKSSVDRYANLEVNFLLQRIERFAGITILTTNFEAGIDDAFARRIRFRIAFDEPDARARYKLWRALLPDDVPIDDDIDWKDLAKVFELTGGHIKEVILRAAALAVTEEPPVVTHELLVRAANVEYRKLGKIHTGRSGLH